MNNLNENITKIQKKINRSALGHIEHETYIEKKYREYILRTYRPFLNIDSPALSFGCSAGAESELLSKLYFDLDIVEGSKELIQLSQKHVPSHVNFIHSLFESFESKRKYTNIFVSYILEHVDNPVDILKTAKNCLNESGYIFVAVPNAFALSRQLGKEMGFLESVFDLTPSDLAVGHQRVYCMDTLHKDINKANLKIVQSGGVMVKFLGNNQINNLIGHKYFPDNILEGCYNLGFKYPDLCGTIYTIVTLPNG